MKLGIVGVNSLSESMIKIFLRTRTVKSTDISVYDTDASKLNYIAGTYDVNPCNDLEMVIQNSEIVFVTVNESAFAKFIATVDVLLKTFKPLVVSMTNGISLEEIEDMMNFMTPMGRVVANVNSATGQGITAYCFNELATDEQKVALVELLSVMGQLVEIEEEAFDAFGLLSVTASAFSCSLMNTLIECAVQSGLPRDVARQTALACVSGASKSISDSGASVNSYLDTLCGSQGIAGKAMLSLKENNFDKAVIRGFNR